MRERGPDGRFLPGNKAAAGNAGGRPRVDEITQLQNALGEVLGNGTLAEWTAAMKRRLARGDQWATEFMFNRLIGKVADKQELTGDAAGPVEIVIRHVEIPVPDRAQANARAREGAG